MTARAAASAVQARCARPAARCVRMAPATRRARPRAPRAPDRLALGGVAERRPRPAPPHRRRRRLQRARVPRRARAAAAEAAAARARTPRAARPRRRRCGARARGVGVGRRAPHCLASARRRRSRARLGPARAAERPWRAPPPVHVASRHAAAAEPPPPPARFRPRLRAPWPSPGRRSRATRHPPPRAARRQTPATTMNRAASRAATASRAAPPPRRARACALVRRRRLRRRRARALAPAEGEAILGKVQDHVIRGCVLVIERREIPSFARGWVRRALRVNASRRASAAVPRLRRLLSWFDFPFSISSRSSRRRALAARRRMPGPRARSTARPRRSPRAHAGARRRARRRDSPRRPLRRGAARPPKCATHASGQRAERRSAALEIVGVSFRRLAMFSVANASRRRRATRDGAQSLRALVPLGRRRRRQHLQARRHARAGAVAPGVRRRDQRASPPAKLSCQAAPDSAGGARAPRRRRRATAGEGRRAVRAARGRRVAPACSGGPRAPRRWRATTFRHARAAGARAVNVTTTESSSKNRPSLRARVSRPERRAAGIRSGGGAPKPPPFSMRAPARRRSARPASAARAGAAAFLRHALAGPRAARARVGGAARAPRRHPQRRLRRAAWVRARPGHSWSSPSRGTDPGRGGVQRFAEDVGSRRRGESRVARRVTRVRRVGVVRRRVGAARNTPPARRAPRRRALAPAVRIGRARRDVVLRLREAQQAVTAPRGARSTSRYRACSAASRSAALRLCASRRRHRAELQAQQVRSSRGLGIHFRFSCSRLGRRASIVERRALERAARRRARRAPRPPARRSRACVRRRCPRRAFAVLDVSRPVRVGGTRAPRADRSRSSRRALPARSRGAGPRGPSPSRRRRARSASAANDAARASRASRSCTICSSKRRSASKKLGGKPHQLAGVRRRRRRRRRRASASSASRRSRAAASRHASCFRRSASSASACSAACAASRASSFACCSRRSLARQVGLAALRFARRLGSARVQKSLASRSASRRIAAASASRFSAFAFASRNASHCAFRRRSWRLSASANRAAFVGRGRAAFAFGREAPFAA